MQPNKKPLIEVISSKKISEDKRDKIKNEALSVFKLKSADFQFSEDENLIAGFVLKFGSKVLDLTLKGKIQSL